MTFIVIQLVVMMPVFQVPGPERAISAHTEAQIREILSYVEDIDRKELARLGGFSPVAFPLYVRILNDPKEDSYIVLRTLGVLAEIKGDRSQFVDLAVTNLAHSHTGVRRSAVHLLSQIGTSRDAVPVVCLLSDEDFTVGVAAAATIQAIGGPRDLAALNTWLAVSNDKRYTPEYRKQYEILREYVTKARDGLKQRLDKEKEKAKTPKS